MSKDTEEHRGKKAPVMKVKDATKQIEATVTFLNKIDKVTSANEPLRILLDILKPHENSSLQEVQAALDFWLEKKQPRYLNVTKPEILKTFGLAELQDRNARALLSRGELSELAQRELGLSRSNLMRLSRKEMETMIDNALDNLKTLDTIGRLASRGG